MIKWRSIDNLPGPGSIVKVLDAVRSEVFDAVLNRDRERGYLWYRKSDSILLPVCGRYGYWMPIGEWGRVG